MYKDKAVPASPEIAAKIKYSTNIFMISRESQRTAKL
jgi:hypothetical protein